LSSFLFNPFTPFTISSHLLHLIHSPRLHQPPPPRLPAPAASSPPMGSPGARRPPSPRDHAPQHPPRSGRPAFSVLLVSSAAGGRSTAEGAHCRRPGPPAQLPSSASSCTSHLTGVLLHLPSRPPLMQRPSTFTTSTALWWSAPVLHPPAAPSSLALGVNR
jgi:hypothetical protein